MPLSWAKRTAWVVLVFACAFVCVIPAMAQTPPASSARPKTIVLLASGLDWEDTKEGGALGDLRAWAQNSGGGFALLNPAVSGEATEAAAYLSVGAGERMSAPETAQSGPALWEAGIKRSVVDMAQEAYTIQKREGRIAGLTYRRRMGMYPPEGAAVLHVGVPVLRAAQPTEGRAVRVGALGDALQKGGRTVAVWGDWRAVLVGMNGSGTVPVGTTLEPFDPETLKEKLAADLPNRLTHCDVLIVSVPDARVLRVFVRAVLPLTHSGRANVLLAAIAPPTGTDNHWEALGFAAAWGPDFAAPSGGNLLVSPTTRTPGLVANVDIAPTICRLQGVPPELLGVGSAGRPFVMDSSGGGDPMAQLDRFDNQVRASTNAAVPVLVGWGLLAFAGAFAAVLGAWRRLSWLADVAQLCLLMAAGTFLALLPVGIFGPPSPAGYTLLVLAGSAVIALVALTVGIKTGCSPLGLIFAVTVFIIAVDTAFGSPLIAHSALSGYYLAGVRFYGIGNEYLGVLIGATLCGIGLLAPTSRSLSMSVRARFAFAVLALVLTLLVSLPNLGAKAGGAFCCTVAFTCAFAALGTGKLRVRHIACAFVLAFLVVGLLAAWDASRPDAMRSHIGEAAVLGTTGGTSGLQKIAALVQGKIAMNARLTATPYTLGALLLFTPLWFWIIRGTIGEKTRTALQTRPAFQTLIPAALWGTGACLVFNDSGIVAALLLLACLTASILFVLCDADAISRNDVTK